MATLATATLGTATHGHTWPRLMATLATATLAMATLATATLAMQVDTMKLELKAAAKEKNSAKVGQLEKRINKAKQDMEQKDRLKCVSLGTSKINYNDPRITVAWCKRHDVPIHKPFPKTLMSKFSWAMSIDPEFRF